MNEQLFHTIENAFFTTYRHEKIGDKSYFVVKGVPLVEGVLNGRLVEKNEFGKFVKDWDGVPVVLRHPKKNGGSARVASPDVPVIGRFYNASLDGTRLVGEFWFDEEKLSGDEEQALIEKIKANHPIEISTGYYAESLPKVGKWNEKDYGLVDTNLHPDHIAVLPDELGACSIADGCGLNRNERETPMRFDISLVSHVTGLTGKAADLWEKVYQSYKDEGKSEEEAAKRAWGAVKQAGYKKDKDDNWTKSNQSELVEIENTLDIPPDDLVGLASLVAFVAE